MQQGEPGAPGNQGPVGPKVRASPPARVRACTSLPWVLRGREGERLLSAVVAAVMGLSLL